MSEAAGQQASARSSKRHPLRNSVYYLLVINILVFLVVNAYERTLLPEVALFFFKSPEFVPWQYLTYMFTHVDTLHLVFNMYMLWMLGSPLLMRWGNVKFLLFYFVSGIGGALFYTAMNYTRFVGLVGELEEKGCEKACIDQVMRLGRIIEGRELLGELSSLVHIPTIGASGAVYGLFVAFAATFPRAKLVMLFLPYPIKAIYVVPAFVLLDLVLGITNNSLGNIAHFVHVGGALVGALMVLVYARMGRSDSHSF